MSDSGRPRVPWWRVDFGEDASIALAEALRARKVTMGAVTTELESELAAWLDVAHVVATNSGSSALLATLVSLGLGPGDEVIVPCSTFIAPANAAALIGAGVKLVDVLPDRPLIDPSAVERAVSPATRAIVAVHSNGRAADMAALERIASSSNAVVIADCAQALGSRDATGLQLGASAHAACFSMGVTKLLPCGEGGFVATSNARLAERLRGARNHGVERLSSNRFPRLGFNLRPTDLLAALALSQLPELAARMQRLRALYERYARGLAGVAGIELLPADLAGGELPLWVEIVCESGAARDDVIARLDGADIDCKPFHPPLSDSPHLGAAGDFPNAVRFGRTGLVLPSGPDQTVEDCDRVIDLLSRG